MARFQTWEDVDFPEDPWDAAFSALVADDPDLTDDDAMSSAMLALTTRDGPSEPEDEIKQVHIPDDVQLALQAPKTSLWHVGHLEPWLQPMQRRGILVSEQALQVGQRIASFFFGDEPKLQASKEAIGIITNISTEKVEQELSLFSNALLHLERSQCSSLLEIILRSDCKPICFVELTRFDETPLLVSHRQSLPEVLGQGPILRRRGQAQFQSKTANVCKMLCTEQKYAMLLHCKLEGDATIESQYVALTGDILTWNQLLERTTGVCQYQALQETGFVPQVTQAFQLKIRGATTDQAGQNFLAEQYAQKSRGDPWCSLHMPCLVHKIARILGNVMGMLEADISGMVNLSLVLSIGANMAQFRASMCQVITERLVIKKGEPPQEALDFRSFILRSLCETGSKQHIKKSLLGQLPNGNWQDHT